MEETSPKKKIKNIRKVLKLYVRLHGAAFADNIAISSNLFPP